MDEYKEEIKNVINETLKNFTYLSDANTIVGTPVVTSGGTTVIPVSKMTVAFLSGGGQYGEIKMFQPNKNYPLSTGSGGIVSVKPSGFIVEERGRVKFVSCPEDHLEKAVDGIINVLEKLYEKI